MSGFTSPEWYRVAEARLRLRPDVEIRQHHYLGQPWYVLSDRTGGKVHRVTPAAMAVLGRFDGSRPTDAIWQGVVADYGEEAPTQTDVLDLLGQLHAADLLTGPDRPALDDLLDRRDKAAAQGWKKVLLNPLSATVPLVDPDRFLIRLDRLMSVLPRGVWWALLLAILAPALVLLPAQAEALRNRGLAGMLDLENLFLIALIYPVVKALHEIGHGLVTRARGGEVHEMGLMFIAFFPIPYVDATASLAFPSKWSRAAVAAAGVIVELAIAALAFYVWIWTEDGTLRVIAYNTMVISGLSTLLINGNPLLKFDGYHVLCDLIEIPNLSKRGNTWWGEELRRIVLGTREPRRLPLLGWEKGWFLLYPPLAFLYRIAITFTIALTVAATYRTLGVLLALWSLALTLAWPAVRTAWQTIHHPAVAEVPARARRGALAAGMALVAALGLVPVPQNIVAEGVVWLPPEAFLRAGSDGIVTEVTARTGEAVSAGQEVALLDAPERLYALAVADARFAAARADYAAARAGNRTRLEAARAALGAAEAGQAEAARRLADLHVAAGTAGRLDLPQAGDLRGRYLREGVVVGHVIPDGPPLVRVLLDQSQAPLVRDGLRGLSLRFAHAPAEVLPARLVREVPGGEAQVTSPVLTLDGGGAYATTPDGNGNQVTHDRLFQFEIALDGAAEAPYGMRAHVRFELPPRPVLVQLARHLRQRFLEVFDV